MFEVALRSSAVLVVAWLLVRMMPRATAATRHLVWHVALLAVVVAPAASFAVPDVPIVPTISDVLRALPDDVAARRALEALDSSSASAGTAGPSVAVSQRVSARRDAANAVNWLDAGAVAILGTIAFSLWFGSGWLATARVVRRSRRAPAEWQNEVNALCARLGIWHEVRLGIIDQHSSPLATGVFRARILLPHASAAWSAERRRAVLLHELAHIERRDCRVQLLAQAACAMYWFNPLVWAAVAQLRSERERACDDAVLRQGAQASSYAAHLLDIARELRPSLRPSAALAMARPSELEGRLLAVLANGRARIPARGTRWAVVTVMAATTVTALGASSVATREVPASAVAFDTSVPYVVGDDVVISSQPQSDPVEQVEATLQAAPDADERERATLALAFTSGRDVIPALLRALADPDSQVREKAAIGLALRRDQRVIEPLIAAMSDPDSQVREKVAIALGTTGDPRVLDALTRALQDPDSQVREKAAAGLILSGLVK